MRRLSILFLALASAWCADLSGKWQWETMGSAGRTRYTLTLKQDGESISGSVGGEGDDMAIRDGKVSGDRVTFVVARTWGGRERTISYTGRVSGDEIRFKVAMPGAERTWDVLAKRVP